MIIIVLVILAILSVGFAVYSFYFGLLLEDEKENKAAYRHEQLASLLLGIFLLLLAILFKINPFW